VDGLGFGQGYAVDLGLRVGYDVTRNWQVSAGWRMLAGGVDNSDTYAFARFQTVTAGVAYRF
jgi:opacity protein-like surface antigen